MTKLLADTNAFSEWQRGNEAAVSVLKATRSLCISAVVLGELLQGFLEGNRELLNRRDLDRFLSITTVPVIPITSETSEIYARILTDLRRTATPIPTNDVWIAASAVEHGMALWTYDNHFSRVAGLQVIRTAADLVISNE